MAIVASWAGAGLSNGTAVTTSTVGTGDTLFTTATAGAGTVDTSGLHPPSIQVNQAAGAAAQYAWTGLSLPAAGHAVRGYLELSAWPSAGAPILQAYAAGALVWRLDVTAAGLLRIRDAANTVVATASTALDVDVELRVEVSVASGAATAHVYDGDASTPLLTISGAVGTATVDEVRWGNPQSAPTWPTFWLAQLAAANTGAEIGPVPGAPISGTLAATLPALQGAGVVDVPPPPNTATLAASLPALQGAAAVDVPPAWPDAAIGVAVELMLGGQWTRVPGIYTRDPITITRGRADEASQVAPSKMTFTVNNKLGQFSPRNPLGPYYGQLTRNTPVRLTANGSVRFVGELGELPVRWDTSGTDVYVQVEASGILRRLSQGTSAVYSALRRAVGGLVPEPTAYWPMEDAPGSALAASGIDWRQPMRPGAIAFDFEDQAAGGTAGSMTFPQGATAVASVPAKGPGFAIAAWLDLPADMGDANCSSPQICWRTPGTAKAVTWNLYTGTPVQGHALLYYDADDGTTNSVQGSIDLRETGPTQVLVYAVQSGSDIVVKVSIDGVDDITTTITGATVTPVTSLTLNTSPTGLAGPPEIRGSISHLIVAPGSRAAALKTLVSAGKGYAGETAGDRFLRLSGEEGVPAELVGSAADTMPMGPQFPKPYLDLVRECEAADGGVLGEQREEVGLRYRTRAADYNTPPALVLDYLTQVAAPLEPTEDDQQLRNDITVTREGGSSARAFLADGPLSVQDPPGGVGVYDDSVSLNVWTDDLLGAIAGWRLHLGTVDEARFPVVRLKLHKHPELLAQALALDVRSHLRLTGLPPWLPPGDVDLLAEGYTEVIEPLRWTLEFNASPGSPYAVAVVGDEQLGRADTDGSELAAAVDADDTTLLVSSTGGPYWTTDPAERPLDLRAGGELITATSITDAVNDGFDRTLGSGWGSTPEGYPWAVRGATSDYSTGGGIGTMSIGTRATDRIARLPIDTPAADIDVQWRTVVAPVTGEALIFYALVCVAADFGSWYAARIRLMPDGTIRLAIETGPPDFVVLANEAVIPGLAVAANVWHRVRFRVQDSELAAKVWPQGQPEPPWQVTAQDARYDGGGVGVRAFLPSPNTNALPVLFQFGDFVVHNPQAFTVQRAVNGISKAHAAGTDVRLANPAIIAL